MDTAPRRDDGFTVLDGVALVVASAVASVHMRTSVQLPNGAGWGLLWIAFAGIGLSAAGPMLYLVRRYGRRPEGYPGAGDRLWGLIGLPWVLAAPLRSLRRGPDPQSIGLYALALTILVGVTCLVVLAVLWKVWVLSPPRVREGESRDPFWTERIGLAISVAWPLQCAFLLLVLDAESIARRR